MKFSNRLLITIAFVGSVAIADLLLLDHKKSLVWGSSIPGFWALFGVTCTASLLLVSKLVGYFLIRSNDFYESDSNDE